MTPRHTAIDCARALGQAHLPTPEQIAVIEAPLEPMLVVTRGILAPSVERLCDRETAEAAIEWGVRMVLSYTFTPSHRVRLTDNGDVHRLVSTYFLPGTTVASSSANGSSPPDQAIQPSNPMFNPTAISAEPSH